MADYLRKPPIGTAARERHDDELRAFRRRPRTPCKCGSGVSTDRRTGRCVLCDFPYLKELTP